MKRNRMLLALVALALSLPGRPQAASGVVADLSHHLIAITTAFAGTDVLLFGALEDAGTDVAVVVRGPASDAVVRKKNRVGPIWLNTEEVTFAGAPSYYAAAASKPLAELADVHELKRHGIGVRHIGLERLVGEGTSEEVIAAFTDALIRNKKKVALYSDELLPVRFVGQRLFRTTLAFPANVPPGQYEVQVFEIRDGVVASAQHNALLVSKVGVEADIYDAAYHSPALYALASIVLAVAAGWAASAIFRK
ncbi:MAG: TIGR02186 family protein [Geminicoccaceae bacterium]|nr:TIGR02186 family protein [Geminicoccaceae bacterium]